MYFYIKQNSTLPTLRMELIDDGGYTYNHRFHECIQGADITFTMVNAETNVVKISKAKAYVKRRNNDSCDEQYVICYDWKARDTKECGTYEGTFEITFSNEMKSDDYESPTGILNMPIRETLYIVIR
jgi:hypothetical protein